MSAGYGGLEIVHGANLDVSRGTSVAILGPNGAGKTTLLRALVGLCDVLSGSILHEGRELRGLKTHAIARLGIALVPEGRHLFPDMSVRENLLLGGEMGAGAETLDYVMDLFPRLGERVGQRAGSLSGGEQQMLAVGRALMSRPRLLLLDEPSTGLAPQVVDSLFAALGRVKNEEQLTIVVVEQRATEALELADFTYVLEGGRMVDAGPASEFADRGRLEGAYFGDRTTVGDDQQPESRASTNDDVRATF